MEGSPDNIIVSRGEINNNPTEAEEQPMTLVVPTEHTNYAPIVTRETEVPNAASPVSTEPPPPSAIEVAPVAEDSNKASATSPVQIKSVGDAVNFLLKTNQENVKRDEAMVQEQQLRLEAYGDGSKAVLSFMPSAIGKGLDTVTGAMQAAIPAPLANVAQKAGDQVTNLAGKAANVINSAPSLVINTIPTIIMSEEAKQLIFGDFNNTLRSFFHTNVLAMPYVFSQTGVVMGLIIMLVVSIMCEFATELYLLAKYALPEPNKVMVYGDVPRLTFGDWYPTFNIFYGVIHLVGFQVFAAKNTQVMLRSVFGVTDATRGYVLGMLIPSLVAVPLVLMKSAHNQRPLSIISNSLVLISVIVLLFYFPYDAFDVSTGPTSVNTVSNLGVALGVIVYAFTGIGSVVPVERTMPRRRYKSLLRPAVAISFLLLVFFGISGYVSYGGNTCSVITMSLEDGSTKTAVSVMLFIASVAIIPQQVFPFAEVMDRRLLGLPKLPTYFQLNANVCRLGAVAGCAVIAYYIPYYGLMSAISGALGCSVLGFIVPGLLERTRRMRRNPSLAWYENLIVYSMVFSGIFILFASTISALYQMFNVVDLDYVATCR